MEGNAMIDDTDLMSGIDAGNAITVPESIQGTEEDVVGKERWEEIRRWKAAGRSISKIARQLALDRKTVRSCLTSLLEAHEHAFLWFGGAVRGIAL